MAYAVWADFFCGNLEFKTLLNDLDIIVTFRDAKVSISQKSSSITSHYPKLRVVAKR